ncbi:MAG: DUF3107 domain-containing protein [Actinomycetes bacterium]
MEVKIGVKGAARELSLESAESSDEIAATVKAALADAGGLLVLADEKGRQVLVPVDKLAYVEIGEQAERRVGFGAI